MNLGLLPQMWLMHSLQRYMDGVVERHEARVPNVRRKGTPTVSPRNILDFATVNGARTAETSSTESTNWYPHPGIVAVALGPTAFRKAET